MAGKSKELSDTYINNWYIKDRAGKDSHGNATWNCKCLRCGKWSVRPTYVLTSGHSKGCSCIRDFKDLTGMVFKDRRAIEYIDGKWKCECIKCGNISYIQTTYLTRLDFGECIKCNSGLEDLSDRTFGKMRPIEYNRETNKWKCECLVCGNIKEVLPCNLKNMSTTNCGCERGIKNNYFGRIINNIVIKEHIKYTNYWRYTCEICGFDGITRSFNIKDGTCRCENCTQSNKYRSSYEIEIENLFGKAVENSRSVVIGHEIDLYYPKERIGIEFNGNYWHNEFLKDSKYHQLKSIDCLRKDIRLIHIFEYEWLDKVKREIVLSILNTALKNNKNKIIYARNTDIRLVNKEDLRVFLNDNHLQGYCSSGINIGLYSKVNNELLEVMTFGTPRFNNKYEWELIRLCTKKGYIVVGGTEKLFKHFIKEYKPVNIVSYCNISKFDGEVYYKLGFKFIELTKPNYVWVSNNGKDVLTRYQTMKKKLIKRFGLDDNCKETEDDIMHFYGYMKIYDCGNIVFEWNKES